jgi:hypothetical protein
MYMCRVTAATCVPVSTQNQNFINIYLRRILQVGKWFPRNRKGKNNDEVRQIIKKHVTYTFYIHSIGVTRVLRARGPEVGGGELGADRLP